MGMAAQVHLDPASRFSGVPPSQCCRDNTKVLKNCWNNTSSFVLLRFNWTKEMKNNQKSCQKTELNMPIEYPTPLYITAETRILLMIFFWRWIPQHFAVWILTQPHLASVAWSPGRNFKTCNRWMLLDVPKVGFFRRSSKSSWQNWLTQNSLCNLNLYWFSLLDNKIYPPNYGTSNKQTFVHVFVSKNIFLWTHLPITQRALGSVLTNFKRLSWSTENNINGANGAPSCLMPMNRIVCWFP